MNVNTNMTSYQASVQVKLAFSNILTLIIKTFRYKQYQLEIASPRLEIFNMSPPQISLNEQTRDGTPSSSLCNHVYI